MGRTPGQEGRFQEILIQVDAHNRFEPDGVPLAAGDGAAVTGEPALRVRAPSAARVLLFDLP